MPVRDGERLDGVDRAEAPAWSAAPARPRALPAQVHVWRVELDGDPGLVESSRRLLTSEELRRADRFYFPKHRDRFAVAKGALRTVLGRYLDLDPRSLLFLIGSHGKPSLDPRCGPAAGSLRFNVSHSNDVALLAVAVGREVGVDVERLREDLEVEEIAGRFFSAREIAALEAIPPERRHEAFFTCWTRKEAFIKARGEGLSMPLDRFDVTVEPGSAAALLATRGEALDARGWTLRELHPGRGYAGAVAAEGGSFRLECFDWSPEGV